MGVMLSLDRHRPVSGRRRAQHARREDGWARARALATTRRCDAPARAGMLSRFARALLPWRNRSAGGRPPGYEGGYRREAAVSGGRPDAGRAPAA
jgi:hypothetical protein